jgi:hypothetical protein
MSELPQRQPPGAGRIALFVLAGLIPVLLLLAGTGGYVAYREYTSVKTFFIRSTSGVRVAEAFLSQIQTDNSLAAYEFGSQTFRKNQSPEQFEKFVAKHPTFSNHTIRTSGPVEISTVDGVTRYRARYNIVRVAESLTCTLVLVEENGVWLVESFTVP